MCVFQRTVHPYQESEGPYLKVCKDKQSISVSKDTRSALMKNKSVYMQLQDNNKARPSFLQH